MEWVFPSDADPYLMVVIAEMKPGHYDSRLGSMRLLSKPHYIVVIIEPSHTDHFSPVLPRAASSWGTAAPR